MRIEEHPFYVLGITPRSSKREILERAEALKVEGDSEKIDACRFQVTHPARRIEAEVSWFPSASPSRVRRITELVLQDPYLPTGIEEKLAGLDCLGRFNALAYWLESHEDASAPAWCLGLMLMAKNLQKVDQEQLRATLNEDRSAAGIPQITDATVVESAVTRLGESTSESLAEHLMQCRQSAQVLTLLVERYADSGESRASDFISRFVHRYQTLVQPTLEQLGKRVAARAERLLSTAKAAIAQNQPAGTARIGAAFKELQDSLSEWRTIARPVQLLMKSRGQKDARSIEVANRVRSIALTLANDLDLHEHALRITSILHEVFEDVPEVAETLQHDSATLDGIISSKDGGEDSEQERQAELDFDGTEVCERCGKPMIVRDGPSGKYYACTDCGRPRADQSAVPAPSKKQLKQDLTDLATVGALHLVSGVTEYPAWKAAMRAEAGELIDIVGAATRQTPEVVLRQVYDLAIAVARRHVMPQAAPSDLGASVDGFFQLCQSITEKCDASLDQGHNDSAAVRAAFANFRRQVLPWLTIICEARRDDPALVIKAGDAALRCLRCIAGAVMCCNRLEGDLADILESLPREFEVLSKITDLKEPGQGRVRAQQTGSDPTPGRAPEAKSTAQAPTPERANDEATVDGFVELCRAIVSKCRLNIQAYDGHRTESLATFKSAYQNYRTQVSPWLAIICASRSGDTPLTARVRNAAAGCLSAIVSGFVCVSDFDSAQRVALEALPIVFNDVNLEAEIRGQLALIASAKENLEKSAPSPVSRATGTTAGGSPAPRAERAAPTVVAKPDDSETRLKLIVALFALLIAIPLLISLISGPEWHPSVADLTVTGSGGAAASQPPSASHTSAQEEPASAPGARPTPEYKEFRMVPRTYQAEPPSPTYEAVPIVRAETAHEPVSLPNGTELIPSQNADGLGELRISNYTGTDAAVKLKTSVGGATVRFVYVRANSELAVSKIATGAYILQFATGRDFDATRLAFRQDRGFAAFDKALSFSERDEPDGTVYSIHKVTLHEVANGNVQKRQISAEAFSDDVGTSGRSQR